MSAAEYSVPDQTEGRTRAFLKWERIDLSFKLVYMCYMWGNVNYYKSVHHPITTLPVGTWNILQIFKINQQTLLSLESPDIFSSCPN